MHAILFHKSISINDEKSIFDIEKPSFGGQVCDYAIFPKDT
jgi:hypothetical protein